MSGFLLRQRGLRRKTIATVRSCLADFLAFLAVAGRTPQSLADRLPPHRHLRHESEPHLWTAEEIRRVLAVIDRQSATGKAIENAYEPLTPDTLPDWRLDSSLIGWLDSLGR